MKKQIIMLTLFVSGITWFNTKTDAASDTAGLNSLKGTFRNTCIDCKYSSTTKTLSCLLCENFNSSANYSTNVSVVCEPGSTVNNLDEGGPTGKLIVVAKPKK